MNDDKDWELAISYGQYTNTFEELVEFRKQDIAAFVEEIRRLEREDSEPEEEIKRLVRTIVRIQNEVTDAIGEE